MINSFQTLSIKTFSVNGVLHNKPPRSVIQNQVTLCDRLTRHSAVPCGVHPMPARPKGETIATRGLGAQVSAAAGCHVLRSLGQTGNPTGEGGGTLVSCLSPGHGQRVVWNNRLQLEIGNLEIDMATSTGKTEVWLTVSLEQNIVRVTV